MPTQHLTLTTTTDTLETITAMEAKQEIAIQPAMAAQAPYASDCTSCCFNASMGTMEISVTKLMTSVITTITSIVQ